MFEAPEIASMSVRTLEVFLYGPKPKIVEWLVIEPAHAVADNISKHIHPLLTRLDPDQAVLVSDEEGCLTIEWRWWRPALRAFLQQVVRECPSVVIGPEERSELDLNGIWHGLRERPDPGQRRMLAKATRLGFGCECAGLLSRYRSGAFGTFQEAGAYLAEIAREEAGTEHSAICR
jgi:hypothetical protein